MRTHSPTHVRQLLGCFLLGVGLCLCASGILYAAPPLTPSVTILPREGCNLRIVEQLASTESTRIIVQLTTPVHNWIAATFHLPIAKPLSIDICMAGNDTPRNSADVSKWISLKPMFTYADPDSLACQEWFTKNNAGVWQSSDLFKTGNERFAGTQRLPIQQAMPEALAEEFLSADGQTWLPWKEVDHVEVLPSDNIFRVSEQKFACDTVTLCLRNPYFYAYELAFLAKLKAAALPGTNVDEIGFTPTGKKLFVIRLLPPVADNEQDRPTILLYAREHATEPDGSFMLEGLLRWLLSTDAAAQVARQNCNWLLIPILDVDGSCRSEFRLGDFFQASKPVSREAIAYANYVIKWIDSGHQLELIVNYHNLECGEGPNLLSPMVNALRQDSVRALNTAIFNRARLAGFSVGDPAGWQTGIQSARFAGWCYDKFQSYELAFECNSRAPESRLNLPDLQRLGGVLGQELADFVQSPAFVPIRQDIKTGLAARNVKRQAWWSQVGHDARHRTVYDILTLGY